MARARFYIPGMLYTRRLEVLFRGMRRSVCDIVLRNDLYPLLDLCCGPGTQAGLLRRQGKPVLGLDINLKMLKYAASRGVEVSFCCADAARVPFPAGTFRGLVVSFALHEKEAAFRANLLKEAMSVLAPGGGIVFVDFEKPRDTACKIASLFVSVIEP